MINIAVFKQWLPSFNFNHTGMDCWEIYGCPHLLNEILQVHSIIMNLTASKQSIVHLLLLYLKFGFYFRCDTRKWRRI